MRTFATILLSFSCFSSYWMYYANAFSIKDTIQSHNQLINNHQHHHRRRHPVRSNNVELFSTTGGFLVNLEREAVREVDQLQGWAGQCGVQPDSGFYLDRQQIDDVDDWYAATSTGAQGGSRLLYVPGEMILSAAKIAQEYDGYANASFQVLADMGMNHLFKHFYLFLKVLVEYEQGDSSPYYPWFQGLPRKYNTAASMDNFCLSCLPPFLKSLCQIERDQLGAFRQALNVFDYVSPETKANLELMKFAYNVVFTRSWRSEEGDYRIVPVADMINHGYPDNVAITYDEYGGCQVTAKEDIPPGSPLTLSYGQPNNPSRFLATYGFINDSPSFFCKMLIANPSQELRDLGYNPNRMLFFSDGGVSSEVWDVLLYSRLEKKQQLENVKNAFYQAHMSGDEQTKQAIHAQYQADTVKALSRHVNHILAEVAELTVKMNSFDSSKHPRLPLLKRHHDMVTRTFTNVKNYLEQMQG